MKKCIYCGYYAIGSSPTGEWCNACGWASPCECEVKPYIKCKFHQDRENGKLSIKEGYSKTQKEGDYVKEDDSEYGFGYDSDDEGKPKEVSIYVCPKYHKIKFSKGMTKEEIIKTYSDKLKIIKDNIKWD